MTEEVTEAPEVTPEEQAQQDIRQQQMALLVDSLPIDTVRRLSSLETAYSNAQRIQASALEALAQHEQEQPIEAEAIQEWLARRRELVQGKQNADDLAESTALALESAQQAYNEALKAAFDQRNQALANEYFRRYDIAIAKREKIRQKLEAELAKIDADLYDSGQSLRELRTLTGDFGYLLTKSQLQEDRSVFTAREFEHQTYIK